MDVTKKDAYCGEWIALFRGMVVAHGMKIKDVYQEAGGKHQPKDILFVKVPGKNSAIYAAGQLNA